MANVKFLRGLQASLPAQGAATDGAFYLTTDTNRLYVGQGTNLVELNKSITIVDVIENPTSGQTALPTTNIAEGQFYYVKNNNILCVYENSVWKQINPDTDRVIAGTELSISKDTTGNDIVFNLAIPLQAYNLKTGLSTSWPSENIASTLTGSITLTSADVTQLTTNVNVSMSGAFSSDHLTFNVDGTGADATKTITISGGSNMNVTGTASGITLDPKSYYLKTENNKIGITTDSESFPSASNTFATFLSGTGINISTNESAITVAHAAPASSPSGTYGSFSGYTVSVPRITVDALGHITSATTVSHNLKQVTAVDVDDATIKLTIDGDTESPLTATISKFANYYTSSQVDTSLATLRQQLNGMTYKGVVTSTTVPNIASSISIGYMYLVRGPGVTVGEEACKEGDLIIAKGDEDSSGYITSNLAWDRIQVDYNTDTQYTFSAASNAIVIKNAADAENTLASFSFASPSNTIGISQSNNTFNFDINWGTF